MPEAALQLYESLTSYTSVEALIESAEAEGLYIECKAPAEPRLSREQKAKLAQAVSGFSNTAGGIILWGVSTTKHDQSDLDVLTQIEPIGNISHFADQVSKTIPTLSTPAIIASLTRTIKRNQHDTKGLALTYIPQTQGDPVQSALDNLFYFRAGDQFVVAPYEMIKRLFAATESPDLHVAFTDRLVTMEPDGKWKLPICVRNDSSAIAEHVVVHIRIDNPEACEQIELSGLDDISAFNPGQKLFSAKPDRVIHRGLIQVLGTVMFKMKVSKRAKRNIKIKITLYANKMRARTQAATIVLAKKGFAFQTVNEEFLY